MTNPYIAPRFSLDAFNCPYCRAYARMTWDRLYRGGVGFFGDGKSFQQTDFHTAECERCKRLSVWLNDEAPLREGRLDEAASIVPHMVEPVVTTAVPRHPDLPVPLVADYEEARRVLGISPRSAAALLRLVVQRLCKELGTPGRSINDDIAVLVKKGLPPGVQQALDSVRVIGNNAVHPGQMSADDVGQVAEALFKIVNMIVDELITKPKQIQQLYGGLPEGTQDAIDRRDGN